MRICKVWNFCHSSTWDVATCHQSAAETPSDPQIYTPPGVFHMCPGYQWTYSCRGREEREISGEQRSVWYMNCRKWLTLWDTVDEKHGTENKETNKKRDCKCIMYTSLYKKWGKVKYNNGCWHVCTYSPIFGVWTLNVLTFFEVSLQVHGEQWWAGGVVGAADWPIVTTDLMFSAEVITVIWGWGVEYNKCGAALQFVKEHINSLCGPYLRADSLMVKGQPSGSTSYAPGFPATVEVEAAAPPALLAVALQPYLQWMNSSPICSATAMLFTTTVSLAASTGHLSVRRTNMVVRLEETAL